MKKILKIFIIAIISQVYTLNSHAGSDGTLEINSKTKEKMREVLKDIQSGKFTKQWMDEHKSGQKNFLKMRQDLAKHPIEKVGKELRAMMPWIGKNKLVDKDKN